MRVRSLGMVAVAVVLGFVGLACGAGDQTAKAAAFPATSVRFEQNATDEDVEVVFEATGNGEGVAELTIVGPDGRTVVDFRAPDSTTMGIRSFKFESPEPQDVEGLKAAYPSGAYRFSGKTVSGGELTGEATLSHELPATATFEHPSPEAEGISTQDLEMSWSAVAGVEVYIIEIELEDSNLNLTVNLPGTMTHFAVPNGFLKAATEYKMVVGTVSDEGNRSFVETTFTTAD